VRAPSHWTPSTHREESRFCRGLRRATKQAVGRVAWAGFGWDLIWANRLKRISPVIAISSYHFNEIDAVPLIATSGTVTFGGSMTINFVLTRDGSDDSIRFQPMERLKVYLFGATVLFASFGMGEAVYRLLFSEFDGITDRIPVEVLFGLVFAWLATKFVGGVYRNRKERSARLNFIWARNHQIRGALEGITPLAHPSKNQQSIRVIREEVERIEWALKEILPGKPFGAAEQAGGPGR
jgi:hypothetical protein